MNELIKTLETAFLGNPLWHWAAAFATGIALLVALRLLQGLAATRLAALAQRTETHADDAILHALQKTKLLVLIIVSVYAGTFWLHLPNRATQIIDRVIVIALLLQAAIWAGAAVKAWLQSYRERRLAGDPAAVTGLTALGFVIQLVLWVSVLLLILDNLGINITTLVTGLGIGGVAVALAVQNILGDLFASLSIVLDKPFVIGDFLIIDQHMGTVENVGLKTTRIRSLSGEQLVFANSDLLKSRIHNYGRMYERRIVFSIGVTYQTPREKLKIIPDIIREAITSQERTRFDRAHFKEYGNFSINFESVYYVLVPDYNVYMDIQQAVNLRIHERFEDEGIEFAYPTQTIILTQAAEPS